MGANADDDAGGNSGSAYLFDVATGEQLYKLTADDAAEGDLFGTSVSVSGGIAIVGAPRSLGGPGSGWAYLFDVATGGQLHKLTAADAAAGDGFGYSVSVSGGVPIVGVPGDDILAKGNSGSAYLFAQSVLCPADLNGDGAVDAFDLAILLGSWGPCQ